MTRHSVPAGKEEEPSLAGVPHNTPWVTRRVIRRDENLSSNFRQKPDCGEKKALDYVS